MGFLDKIIAKDKSNTNEQWIHLTEMDQLDQLIQESADLPVVIFKHSTTCGISSAAQHRLVSQWDDIAETDMKFYYLDLLTYRPISNAVAERLGIVHQSPQVIVIRDGAAVYDTSHHSVSIGAIAPHIA